MVRVKLREKSYARVVSRLYRSWMISPSTSPLGRSWSDVTPRLWLGWIVKKRELHPLYGCALILRRGLRWRMESSAASGIAAAWTTRISASMLASSVTMRMSHKVHLKATAIQ